DPGPRMRIGHKRAEHSMIELMAAANRAIRAEQRPSGQREVANRIKHLVANELVRKADTFSVEDAVIADHQGIFQRGAERIARIPQVGHITHEAERARTRDFAAEAVRLHIDGQRLASDKRVVEPNFRLDTEATRIGPQLAESLSHCHPHRLQYPDITARLIEDFQTD